MKESSVTEASPKDMKNAIEMWERVTQATTWVVIGTAVLLVLMVIFLV